MVTPAVLTVAEYAPLVRLTRQAVALQCRRGRIPGACRAPGSTRWLIPRAALPAAAGETAAERRARAAAALERVKKFR